MYKVNGPLNFPTRRKLRELDFRAPEDRLAVEEQEESIARSRAVDHWINEFFDAHAKGDDCGLKAALQGVIDANRADHAAAGVPVYAHAPLPEDFAEKLLQPMRGLPESHRKKVVENLVGEIHPGSKALVARQLSAQLERDGSTASSTVVQFASPSTLAELEGGPEERGLFQETFATNLDGLLEETNRLGSPFGLTGEGEGRGGRPSNAQSIPSDNRAAQCNRDYEELGKLGQYMRDVGKQKAELETELARWEEALSPERTERRKRIIEDLNRARSRSTEPGIPPIPPCPRFKSLKATLACEALRRVAIEKWKRDERERLEQEKQEEIDALENELRNLDALIRDATPQKIAAHRAKIKVLFERLSLLGQAEKKVRDRWNAAGCRPPADAAARR